MNRDRILFTKGGSASFFNLKRINLVRCDNVIEADIKRVNIVDRFDWPEICQPYLLHVGAAAGQRSIIETLAITDAVAASVEAKQGNEHHIDRRLCNADI